MGVVVLAKAEGLDLKGTVLGGRGSGEALGIVVFCDGDQRGRRGPVVKLGLIKSGGRQKKSTPPPPPQAGRRER